MRCSQCENDAVLSKYRGKPYWQKNCALHQARKRGRKHVQNGYVYISRNGRNVLEHRAMWEDAYGPIPPGYAIHHKNHQRDDNRLENFVLIAKAAHTKHHNDLRYGGRWSRDYDACVYCGTTVRRHRAHGRCTVCHDRHKRGRMALRPRGGEQEPGAKLTEAQACEIKALHGKVTCRTLMERYGVSRATVQRIHAGTTWRHI